MNAFTCSRWYTFVACVFFCYCMPPTCSENVYCFNAAWPQVKFGRACQTCKMYMFMRTITVIRTLTLTLILNQGIPGLGQLNWSLVAFLYTILTLTLNITLTEGLILDPAVSYWVSKMQNCRMRCNWISVQHVKRLRCRPDQAHSFS